MTDIFLKIANMSLSASWVVFVVLLLRVLLRKAPKWIAVLLWGVVAVRMVCPFSVESVFSLMPRAETIVMGVSSEMDAGIPAVGDALGVVIDESFAPSLAASAAPSQSWLPVFAALWLSGITVLLAYAAISCRRLHRKVDTAILLRENIFQSENVVSPFVFGIFKPKIYLPFGMREQDAEQVIAHERAHIRRKDIWWKPLGFLLLALHWFNPLLWVCYVLFCRDIEFACDQSVIKDLNDEQKADYSQALLTCSVNRRSVAVCPFAFGGLQVKRRVKSVLTYKRPAVSLVLAALLVCGAVAVCFLTDPKVDAEAFVESSVDRVDTVAPAPEGSTDEVKEPTVVPSGGAAEAQDMSLDEWMQAYGQQYPEGERELYYILCHFDKCHVCDEPSGVHTLLCENIGTEDGSVTIYVKDHDDFGSPEVITIPLSAGEKTVLTFDYCFSHAVIAASYGDVSVDRSWTVPLFS